MSWRLILLLIPVAVSSQQFNGNFEGSGLRTFRQLDLGQTNSKINIGKAPENIIVQTIDPRPLDLGLTNSRINSGREPENIIPQTIDPGLVRNGYLPPISSPAPPKSLFEGEQSRETFEFTQGNPVGNEDSLCNGLSGSDLCNFKKNFSSSNTNIVNENSKLSKNLIPPLVDSEPKKESLPKHIDEPSTTISVKSTVTTTKKPATEKTTPTNPIKPFSPPKKFTEPKKVLNNFSTANLPESSVESKNYLPPRPEYSSAAQTPEAAIRPAPQKEEEHHHHDHHHHHHHHHFDENYNICTDPFHSFLCSPLKARKRITGAFPDSLRGQASFNQFQKVSPNAPQPPSKRFLNQGLSPPNKVSPRISTSSTKVETTTFLPRTTQKQKVIPQIPIQYFSPKLIPETSNENDRFYLPPLPVSKQFDSLPAKPDSSNTVIKTIPAQNLRPGPSTYTEPKITLPNTFGSSVSNKFTTHFTTTERPLKTNPTTVKTKATPKLLVTPLVTLIKTKATPKYSAPASIQTAVVIPSTNRPFTSDVIRPSSLDTSYSTQKSNKQLTSFTPFQSTIKPQGTTIHVANINSGKPSSTPFVTEFKSQKVSYFASTPGKQFTTIPQFLSSKSLTDRNSRTSSEIQSSLASPSTPLVNHPSASKSTYQSSANFISTTEKVLIETTKFVPSASTVSATAGRHLDSAFSSSPPQFSTQKSVKPPLAVANVISTTLKPFTPAKNNAFGSVTETREKLSTVESFNFPPRPNEQPSAAQVDVVIADQNENISKDICSDPFHSFLCSGPKARKRITGAVPNVVEAQISKGKELELKPVPAPQSRHTIKSNEKATATSTTFESIESKKYEVSNFRASEARISTENAYPEPEANFPPSSHNAELIKTADTSYYYPKPEKEFPLPTEQEKTTQTTARIPSTTTGIPSTTTGIPSTTTTLAPTTTTQAPTTTRRTTTTSTPVTTTLATSTSPSQNRGYHYDKPEQSFELPNNSQGYSYPKPKKRFELPTEAKFKPLFPENGEKSPDVFEDLGSAVFIPVNKLDKRSNEKGSNGSTDTLPRPLKFGERLKKLERRPTHN